MESITTFRRNANFSQEEVLALIDVWGSFLLKKKFEGHVKHCYIWREIAEKMSALGFTRPPGAIKVKVSNLKADYYKENRKMKSGASICEWPYFAAMNSILSGRPQANDPNVDDTPGDYNTAPALESFVVVQEEETGQEQNFEDGGSLLGGVTSKVELNSMPTSNTRRIAALPKIKRVTRPTRKRPPTENALLSQLVANDQLMTELLEKRFKMEAEEHKSNILMAEAATRFFNSVYTFMERTTTANNSQTVIDVNQPSFSLATQSTTPSKCHPVDTPCHPSTPPHPVSTTACTTPTTSTSKTPHSSQTSTNFKPSFSLLSSSLSSKHKQTLARIIPSTSVGTFKALSNNKKFVFKVVRDVKDDPQSE